MANSIVDTVVGPITGLLDWYEGKQVQRHIPGEDLWQPATQQVSILNGFNSLELQRLRELVGEFLYQKRFIAAGGMALNDRIELSIATQACIPLLELSLDWYSGWNTIVVYPRSVAAQYALINTVVESHKPLGDASTPNQAPLQAVVLYWDDSHGIDDSSKGHEVIRAFAHEFDGLESMMDGQPPLHHNMDHGSWLQIWKQSFDAVKDSDSELGDVTTLPELFAVCSEQFFLNPMDLWQAYPQVYQQLRIFYHQDPLARVSEVAH